MNDLEALLETYIPGITPAQKAKFVEYYRMLADWNNRVNLTAITEPHDVVRKHFADSLLPLQWDLIPAGVKCIDVGTGAGFPGIPLLIMREDISVTLLDSLKKRVEFLNECCRNLGLYADAVHSRAEDAGRDKLYREQYDLALTRAVAPLAVICELTVPFIKVGGSSIAYKSADIDAELEAGKRAFELLKCTTRLYSSTMPWGGRSLVCMQKNERTAAAYPRKAGTPAKKPL